MNMLNVILRSSNGRATTLGKGERPDIGGIPIQFSLFSISTLTMNTVDHINWLVDKLFWEMNTTKTETFVNMILRRMENYHRRDSPKANSIRDSLMTTSPIHKTGFGASTKVITIYYVFLFFL